MKTLKIDRRYGIYISTFLIIVVLAFASFAFIIPHFQNALFYSKLSNSISQNEAEISKETAAAMKKEKDILTNKLVKLSPGNQYLVINTTNNTFEAYKNKQLIRTGICSTGSYIELTVEDKKSYKFETPKGVFTIKSKITNPVWKKPDWAFLEEGLPVPPPNDHSRFEYGVLGDYALNLGDGYLIHGTLYQRFLGLAVTHGCVRLNDSDLAFLYKEFPVGAKVFIY
ncbi:MAG: L,D-transpeptidase [Bacteroidales bacterium]|nr:L,D-transpeptidase [Bacteroidales bacterium]